MKRAALIVGNQNYERLSSLKKAHADVDTVERLARRAGFATKPKRDVTADIFRHIADGFLKGLEPGGTALFWYSGHGVSVDGANFLAPVDADLGTARKTRESGFNLDEFVSRLAGTPLKAAIVVVDACREVPQIRSGSASADMRGLGSPVLPPTMTKLIVIYSTGVGGVALDNLGEADTSPNSLFARKIIPYLEMTDLRVTDAFYKASFEVSAEAQLRGYKQTPGMYTEVSSPIYLFEQTEPPTTAPVPLPRTSMARVERRPSPFQTPSPPIGAKTRRTGLSRWLGLQRNSPAIDEPQRPLWPITLSSALGVDRGRRISIFVGCAAADIFDEVERVEHLLGRVDGHRDYGTRRWSPPLGSIEEESPSEAAIWELPRSEILDLDRDTVEGLVELHFRRHRSKAGASMVLALPPGMDNRAQRLAGMLRESRAVRDADLEIACFAPWSDQLADSDKAQQEADLARQLGDSDEVAPSADRGPVDPAAGAPEGLFQSWMTNRIDDKAFLSRVKTTRELRLAVLSGRFGKDLARVTPAAERRACQLIEAAPSNHQLLFALGSLPQTDAVLHALLRSPMKVRAVAGLVTVAEASAMPRPWFGLSVERYRHGRPLTT